MSAVRKDKRLDDNCNIIGALCEYPFVFGVASSHSAAALLAIGPLAASYCLGVPCWWVVLLCAFSRGNQSHGGQIMLGLDPNA